VEGLLNWYVQNVLAILENRSARLSILSTSERIRFALVRLSGVLP